MRAARRVTGAACVLALAACAPGAVAPDLEAIYAQVAAAAGPGQRPLITVPGTLGSKLADGASGRGVWGSGSAGLSADPDDPEEAALIALPIVPADAPFETIRDGVRPTGILDRAEASILGLPVPVDVYAGALDLLTKGGFTGRRDDPAGAVRDRPPPGTPASFEDYARVVNDTAKSFHFAYDWRRDIPALARDFDAFVQARKRQVAAIRALYEGRSVQPEEVRFDLLAHSMGGLVTRYYLMYGTQPLGESGPLPEITWAGAEHFRRVVFVATPNAGSILALENLAIGESFGPLQPFYPPTLLATHPSAWQLFPRARHNRLHAAGSPNAVLDPLDPAVWERAGWGLLDPAHPEIRAVLLPDLPDDAARRAEAGRHQARLMARARRFHRAMDRWAPPPPHLELFLVVGGGFRTPAAASVDFGTGTFALSQFEEGDGVVLRTSVLLDERQGGRAAGGLATPLRFDTVLLLPDEHVALTANPVFGDNLLFWLLEQPRDPGELRAPSRRSGPKAIAMVAEAPVIPESPDR